MEGLESTYTECRDFDKEAFEGDMLEQVMAMDSQWYPAGDDARFFGLHGSDYPQDFKQFSNRTTLAVVVTDDNEIWGTLDRTASGNSNAFVTVCPELHSQCPGLLFQISDDPDQKYFNQTFKFQGSAIAVEEKGPAYTFGSPLFDDSKATGHDKDTWLKYIQEQVPATRPELLTLAKNGHLEMYQLKRSHAMPVSRDTARHMEDIQKRIEKEEALSEKDKCMLAFANSGTYTIFVKGRFKFNTAEQTKQNNERWMEFNMWFQAMMSYAAMHGNLWFYRHQALDFVDPLHEAFPIESMRVPRWMVTEWTFERRITVDGEGKKRHEGKWQNPEPKTWAQFKNIWLDMESSLFLHRLALVREQRFQSKEIAALLQSGPNCILTAKFCPSKWPKVGANCTYFVSVIGQNMQHFVDGLVPMPTAGMAIEVSLISEVDDSKSVRYKGRVVEDPSAAEGVLYTCAMEGPEDDSIDPTKERNIRLVVFDYTLANQRKLTALSECAKQRPTIAGNIGVNTLGVLFDANVPDPSAADLVAELNTKGARAVANAIADDAHLNKTQAMALRAMIESLNPIVLTQGPPGTGKTMLIRAIIKMFATLGYKVLVTSGQKEAVNNCANVAKRDSKRDREFVHFTGASSTLRGAQMLKMRHEANTASFDININQGLTDPSVEDDPETIIWELQHSADKSKRPQYREDAFGARLRGYMEEWSQKIDGRTPHAMQKEASDYFAYEASLQSLLQATNLTQEDRKEIKHTRQWMEKLERDLGRHFLANHVAAVFCTSSMSCHPRLYEAFKPDILLVDEAALTSLSDIATSMIAFEQTLKRVSLLGDHVQRKAVVGGRGCNEGFALLESSIFDRLIRPGSGYEVTMLNLQYRMHQDICAWLSKEFYNGLLQTHFQTVNNLEPELQVTLRAFWRARLGEKWIGKMRIAIDVTDVPMIKSMTYKQTTSQYNIWESDMVLEIIDAMLYFDPPVAKEGEIQGRKIEASDIGIISPYNGQVGWVISALVKQDNLRAHNNQPKQNRDIQVSSTYGVQGREFNIVLVSMVANAGTVGTQEDRLAVRFIANRGQLCVEMSRARCNLVILGNFQAWYQGIYTKNNFMNMVPNRHLKSLVVDLHMRKDVFTSDEFRNCLAVGEFDKRVIGRAPRGGAARGGTYQVNKRQRGI
ncbi:P-loop containing nucleoside triphosphate hydrolase protein [Lophium mytilinum]|uniref:P-loop containing nucleoside triphosphate hydrolase protein n=1 Tax=Lophium mytilinum TaxID=390894 RepID=A0A6A6QBE6_9PEZI|nr:P-loop containing nucleoside triphosphate hydrolase protein [Lophium mytilinum]